MLTIIIKILKVLNSEQSPTQLSLAICLALIMGFTPLMSLHNLLVVLLVLWFRVNLTFFILSYPLFAFLGWLLSPLINEVGRALLQNMMLVDYWQAFYNTVIGRWSGFYYTAVLGGLVVSMLTALLLFPILQWAITHYREKIYVKIKTTKIMLWLKATKIWQVYTRAT